MFSVELEIHFFVGTLQLKHHFVIVFLYLKIAAAIPYEDWEEGGKDWESEEWEMDSGAGLIICLPLLVMSAPIAYMQ